MTKQRPEFGQLVTINAVIEKTPGKVVRWERRELEKPIRGIYIGYRTLHEGKIVEEKQGGYWDAIHYVEVYFDRESSFEGWKIAFDERRNPYTVLPEDVSWIKPVIEYSERKA